MNHRTSNHMTAQAEQSLSAAVNPDGEQNKPSVLNALRELMPARRLTYQEALQRAEVQAARLLALQEVTEPGVPTDVVTSLPKIEVVLESGMPVSGSAHWENGRWLIRLNEFDHPTRQRFSLLHEYKHIVDHPFSDYIEPAKVGGEPLTHAQLAERVADHFAACVLMPKAWVKTAFCSQTQNLSTLAYLFDVSPKAMYFRLNQLGLLSVGRCSLPTTIVGGTNAGNTTGARTGSNFSFAPRSRRRRYYRSLSSGFLSPELLLRPIASNLGVLV